MSAVQISLLDIAFLIKSFELHQFSFSRLHLGPIVCVSVSTNMTQVLSLFAALVVSRVSVLDPPMSQLTYFNTHCRAFHHVNACPFALVFPQFLSLSFLAFSSFYISRILFLLQGRVSTVPFFPLIPEDGNWGELVLFLFWK